MTEGYLSAVMTFQGMCDASAAVALADNRFLVASDEVNIFQVYNSNHGGAYEQEIDFGHFLNLPHPSNEADVEASASLNGVTYWLGSHGRNSAGELRWQRHQFFATTIVDHGDLVVVKQFGISYTGLITDLLQCHWFRHLTSERLDPAVIADLSPKVYGAVNIEGLTSWQNGLLIGFRNPIPDNKALLVPLLNATDVVLNGAHAQYGDPIYFDLNGRGIRSIDYWPARNLYIVASGSFDGVKDCEFFTWSGNRADPPQLINLGSLGDLNPEAVVTYDGNAKSFFVLSDDGGDKISSNKKCKDLPEGQQKFRGLWLNV